MASRVVYEASFSAETGAAEQNVKRYTSQIKEANAALGQAERTAKQSYQEQMQQARATGASTEQLAKITQQYNQQLYAIGMTAKEVGQKLATANREATVAEDAKAEAIELTNKELQAQVLIVNELAAANVHAHHEAVSGVQATSAAIRGIEGSGGIRAIENFISKTLGLGPAMQLIFPLVGGFMFGKMLYDVGEKIYEVEHKAAHAAETIKSSYEDQHVKAQVTIDDLTVQGDKLQDNIDKLSGHPGNGLRTALDEATRGAGTLLQALIADNKELAALFKQNSVGMLGSYLSGVASTAGQEEKLLADRVGLTKKIEGINADFNKAAANAKSTDEIKRLGEQRDKANHDAVTGTINRYQGEAKRMRDAFANAPEAAMIRDLDRRHLKHGSISDKNSAREAELDVDAGQLQTLVDRQDAQTRVTALTEKEGELKLKADEDKRKKEAAKLRSGAASSGDTRQTEAQRQQWEEQVRILKEGGQLSNAAEAKAWDDLANTVKKGSDNWIYASNKALEAVAKANADQHKLLDEKLKLQEQFRAAEGKQVLSAIGNFTTGNGRGILDQQNSLKALLDAQRESTYQQALAQAQLDASTGKISKYDEAVKLQTLHSNEYTAQLKQLREALAAIDGQDPQSMAKKNGLSKQITDLTSKQQTDSMRDVANVAATTWEGALTNANAVWVRDSRDSAHQVAELYSSILGGVNGNILSAMTGGKTNWGSTFQGIGKQVAGVGLQRVESTILSKMGFGGKADGSKVNPLWVRNADGSLTSTGGTGIGKAASGFMSTALNFLPGGGFLSGLFGGGRAVGGGVDAGTTYLVGERGPELLTMGGSSGYVTNADRTRNALGGSTAYYSIHMDGGVTSEQMHQQMTALLKQNHPQVVRDSVHAMNERMARRPASAR